MSSETFEALFDIFRGQYRRTGSNLRDEGRVKEVDRELDGFGAQARATDKLIAAFDAMQFKSLDRFRAAADSQALLLTAQAEAVNDVVARAQVADRQKVNRAATLDQPALRKKAELQEQADSTLEENLLRLVGEAKRALRRDEHELEPIPPTPIEPKLDAKVALDRAIGVLARFVPESEEAAERKLAEMAERLRRESGVSSIAKLPFGPEGRINR